MRTLITLLLFCSFFTTGISQIYVDASATSGTNDGSSWADAYTDLQTALDSAVTSNELWIAAGIYKPQPGPTLDSTRFTASSAVSIYGGFNGTETMLDERDWEANVTIFSADLNGDDIAGDYTSNREDNARNVLITGVDGMNPFTVDGVSILNGNGREDEIPQGALDVAPWIGNGIFGSGNVIIRNCIFSENTGYVGSAFFIGFGSVIIDNCSFDSNFSQLGGVRIQGQNSALISNSTFTNNTAQIFGAALIAGNTNLNIEDCSFENNTAIEAIGGGVFIFQNSGSPFPAPSVEIRRTSFEGNEAPRGAGFAFNNFFPESQITMDSCNFSENISTINGSGYGAGITIQNLPDNFGGGIPSISIDLQNIIIEDNEADFASGFYLSSSSDVAFLNVEDCIFDGNTTSIGGDAAAAAIVNNGSFVGADFKRVIFEDNEASGLGGALLFFNDNDDGPMNYTLDSCVFDNNIAGDIGGAIVSFAPGVSNSGPNGTILNSIFSENSAGECCGAISSSGENLTIDNTMFDGNTTEATDVNAGGGGAVNITFASNAQITNSIFENNSSDGEGAAIGITSGVSKVFIENSRFNMNDGNSTISNEDSLWMTNVTMIENESNLMQANGGHTQLQNTILSSVSDSYNNQDSTATVGSSGGNLCADGSLAQYLVGSGPYDDFNNTSSELGMDFVPNEISPCVDAGNPDGIMATLDLAGVERFQGVTIDIGAYESSFDTPVRELNALQIDVYPNPFASTLQLSNTEGIEQIRLLDGAGKLVQTLPIEYTLSINNSIAVGVYYLEVVIDGKIYFKKLNKG